jgi:hypothetical protein
MPNFRNRLPRSVREAIVQHLSAKRHSWAVSTTSAVKAIRDGCPDCSAPDDELVNAIAEEAIEKGLGVYFDGKKPAEGY